MAALGEVAARWAPGLWRRAVRAAAWLGGQAFRERRNAGEGARRIRGGRRSPDLACRTRAGFPTSGCHFHSPALAASGDVTSPAGLPRGSLSPRLRPHSPRRGGDRGAGDSGP